MDEVWQWLDINTLDKNYYTVLYRVLKIETVVWVKSSGLHQGPTVGGWIPIHFDVKECKLDNRGLFMTSNESVCFAPVLHLIKKCQFKNLSKLKNTHGWFQLKSIGKLECLNMVWSMCGR